MFKAILTSESHNKILWCNHSNKTSWTILLHHAINFQVAVVQKVDNVIHWINLYPVNSAIGFPNTYPLEGDLSDGQRYPSFEQPVPGQEKTKL